MQQNENKCFPVHTPYSLFSSKLLTGVSPSLLVLHSFSHKNSFSWRKHTQKILQTFMKNMKINVLLVRSLREEEEALHSWFYLHDFLFFFSRWSSSFLQTHSLLRRCMSSAHSCLFWQSSWKLCMRVYPWQRVIKAEMHAFKVLDFWKCLVEQLRLFHETLQHLVSCSASGLLTWQSWCWNKLLPIVLHSSCPTLTRVHWTSSII